MSAWQEATADDSASFLVPQEDAREAKEVYSKEAEELQGALQAQEQEVKQLLSDVSLANKHCHEAESRAEVLQTDLTALQSLQAETEKGNVSCKQQLQKHKNRNSELEVFFHEACTLSGPKIEVAPITSKHCVISCWHVCMDTDLPLLSGIFAIYMWNFPQTSGSCLLNRMSTGKELV